MVVGSSTAALRLRFASASCPNGSGLVAALAVNTFLWWKSSESREHYSACEANAPTEGSSSKQSTAGEKQHLGVNAHAQGKFYGQIPARQLLKPRAPYPLWDYNWDGKGMRRQSQALGTDSEGGTLAVKAAMHDHGAISDGGLVDPPPVDNDQEHRLKSNGVTRHIILIRHAQYDESYYTFGQLTDLGRRQSDLTGKRLAEMLKGVDDTFGPCEISAIHVSRETPARETAEIISQHLPNVIQTEPDYLLDEGFPAQIIPIRHGLDIEQEMDEDHGRIEEAYHKYFWREDELNYPSNEHAVETNGDGDEHSSPQSQHRFEVIVGHGNVIRYFFCRALQLPPEAWLRLSLFNCSLTYLMIKPNGIVSCRLLGDIGHLGHGHTSFSSSYGLAWS